ncbi:MAG: transcription antitermination factor NusB [Candidatus Aminicenantes bacterium]|nr:transcription antitermination factor NusB [Candidatus Aminicenantes bacterium]
MFRIKYSREVILKLLYQIDVLELEGTVCETILEDNLIFFKGLNHDEKEFIKKIIQKVLSEKKQIDGLIGNHLIGWSLKRLTQIDRNLLRMGIGESYFNNEKAIIIDDILRIAKKYSGEDSYRIINAILDKVIQ